MKRKLHGISLARRLTQTGFFLLFVLLFLQTESKGADVLGTPVKLFLDFDPLLLVSTFFSARSVPAAFLWALLVVAVTAVFGRVFCGWACPLGTLNDWVGMLKKGPDRPKNRKGWYRVKYLLLAGLLSASLFGFQAVGFLDPLCLTVRSLALGVFPALNLGFNGFLAVLYRSGRAPMTAIADGVHWALSHSLLAFRQPHFEQGLLVTLLFLLVLGLNFLERRFWCRYLCPLGALLGLCSRYALLKRCTNDACTACGACETACPGGALKADGTAWTPSECFACWSCDRACPTGGVKFGFSARPSETQLDLGRRRMLGAAAAGVAAVAAARVTPAFMPGHPEPLLIRPPGSLSEMDFLARCVSCGECMKVCITGGLQPCLFEAGFEGLWTPKLVPRVGYCEYRCTLCGQVCPTQAIRKLSAEEKAKTRIGTAFIDRSRCLPWAHATPCIVCEEVCPTPKKAIWFESATVRTRAGGPMEVKQPRVDLDLCVGCGICETKCPVVGMPAITVASLGESRSQENQLLLSTGEGYGYS
jgi:ferredoxin